MRILLESLLTRQSRKVGAAKLDRRFGLKNGSFMRLFLVRSRERPMLPGGFGQIGIEKGKPDVASPFIV